MSRGAELGRRSPPRSRPRSLFRILWALVAGLLALWLLAGFTFIPPDRQGVLVVLGQARAVPLGPGLHWRWPPPLGRVIELRPREAKRLTVGFAPPEQVLGRAVDPRAARFLTGDRNIVRVRLTVQYAVREASHYLFAAREIETLLGVTVESALAEVVARSRVDDLLTTDKVSVQQQVQSASQRQLDRYRSGVVLLAVNLESIAPPEEVREAFNDVASAREDRDRFVREAQSYANQVLPVARGEAARLKSEAAAHAAAVRSRALGEVSRFSSLASESVRRPRETRTRLYLETLEEVLPRLEKTVIEAGAGSIDLDFVRPDRR